MGKTIAAYCQLTSAGCLAYGMFLALGHQHDYQAGMFWVGVAVVNLLSAMITVMRED